jgi:hypothetical protein
MKEDYLHTIGCLKLLPNNHLFLILFGTRVFINIQIT